MTAWCVLRHGGRQLEWPKNAMKAADALADAFQPDIVWSTFGSLEAVLVAKRAAARRRCPWVLDIKDNPEVFIPAGLRKVMAWRTRGWAALTANAQFTADLACKWQRAEATVVYSGVDDAFFATDSDADERRRRFQVNLIGSVYDPERLDHFVAGLRSWVQKLPADHRADVSIRYLGTSAPLVREAVRRLCPDVVVAVSEHVPVHEIALLCRHAAVNVYIASPKTFHHKLLELLSCGAPVIAVPKETAESRRLAQEVGGTLVEAADAADVYHALETLHDAWLRPTPDATVTFKSRSYSWRQQAKLLESRLSQLVLRAAPSSQLVSARQ